MPALRAASRWESRLDVAPPRVESRAVRAGFVLLLGLSSLALSACTDLGHPPTARATASPAYLMVNDGYATDVVLDGTASRDDVDDPAGTETLRFDWAIDDPAPQIVDGDLHSPKLTVRLAAARPTTVTLTVTDPSDDSGMTLIRIGITLPGS